MLINREETTRDADHVLRVVGAGSDAGAIRDASFVATRLTDWLAAIERTPDRS